MLEDSFENTRQNCGSQFTYTPQKRHTHLKKNYTASDTQYYIIIELKIKTYNENLEMMRLSEKENSFFVVVDPLQIGISFRILHKYICVCVYRR